MALPAHSPSRVPGGIVVSFLVQLVALVAAAIALGPWATDPATVLAGGTASQAWRLYLALCCVAVILLCQAWRGRHFVGLMRRRRPAPPAASAP
jgi:hypothetical protein